MASDGKKLVVVTGLSGSGKSIALNALEDQGYYCVDNLPVSLLTAFADEVGQSTDKHYRKVAIGVDARSQTDDLRGLSLLCSTLRNQPMACEILYLEAQDEVLLQRFSETRRRHPLSSDERTLADAIALERELLEPLLTNADLRLDTSRTNVHQLRDLVIARVGDREPAQLSLLIQSFGFKHGLPRDADFVFDARCLPNPHWQADLRPLTGRDRPVAEFLESAPQVGEMLGNISDFLDRWIPCFESDGRSYMTIAIGCTGGQHRSVYLTERLGEHFKGQGRSTITRHCELP